VRRSLARHDKPGMHRKQSLLAHFNNVVYPMLDDDLNFIRTDSRRISEVNECEDDDEGFSASEYWKRAIHRVRMQLRVARTFRSKMTRKKTNTLQFLTPNDDARRRRTATPSRPPSPPNSVSQCCVNQFVM